MSPDVKQSFFSFCILAACSSPSNNTSFDAFPKIDASTLPADAPRVDAPVARVDFSMPGPSTVTINTSSLQLGECSTTASTFTPSGTSIGTMLLSHGFSRSKERMRDLANHLATWNITVITPDLCNSSALNTDHPQNGADLAAYASSLSSPVLFAGHSAGGLASAIAASSVPSTKGLLGLDFTDANSLGANALASYAGSRFAIVGEASSCNSNGNGVTPFSNVEFPTVKVNGANHCDFESPTSIACTFVCGSHTGDFSLVAAFATAYARASFNDDPAARLWLSLTGPDRMELVSQGQITNL